MSQKILDGIRAREAAKRPAPPPPPAPVKPKKTKPAESKTTFEFPDGTAGDWNPETQEVSDTTDEAPE
jgi:hypothetical protein